MSRLAAFLGPGRSFGEGIERVRLVESLGYESVWAIQVADREASIVAAAYAAATARIGLGTGVLPIYPRTPVVMAQTAATIDELSRGRFILGIGPSHKVVIEGWHGRELARPLAHMREYVQAVRAILRGETFFGDIYRTAFQWAGYEPLRADLPIYLSCLAPRMCRLAGEIADGAILWMCSPGYIAEVIVPAIAEGRERAGKSLDGFEIVAAVPVALTENVDEGRNAFRRVSSIYWTLPFYRAAIAGGGFAGALEAFDGQGPLAIPDEVVDAFAGVGDVDDCTNTIDAYRGAGVTLPALSSLPRHEGHAGLEATLEALAP